MGIARQIGRKGIVVLLVARNSYAGNEAVSLLAGEGIEVHFVHIDVVDCVSIQSARELVASRFGQLDIVVNNVGINESTDGPSTTARLDAVERVFRTTFLGALAVTQAMRPLLSKSQEARIVNVSSGLASLTLASDPVHAARTPKLIGYSASKAALKMLTVQLAFLLRDAAIKVNSAEAGYTSTDLNNHEGTQTTADGAAEPVRWHYYPQRVPPEPIQRVRVLFLGDRSETGRLTGKRHVCPNCGHIINLAELDLRAITTGIVSCPTCDWSGQIEIQVVDQVPRKKQQH